MVEYQIARRGVRDRRVLEAMRNVPRHLFVPPDQRASAYDDSPLSIGFGQTISQPYIVASMTEQLHIDTASHVLEIGTGCGYQTAILASLASRVFTVEIIPELLDCARRVLRYLKFANIAYRLGDGSEGWQEHATFDSIIVTAAPTQVPVPLIAQLSEGGRMVLPLEESSSGRQSLYLLEKSAGRLSRQYLYDVRFVPLQKHVQDTD